MTDLFLKFQKEKCVLTYILVGKKYYFFIEGNEFEYLFTNIFHQ